MKSNEQSAIIAENEQRLQKWEEPFRDLLDQIYHRGYALNLLKENPEAYQREYYYFIAIYD